MKTVLLTNGQQRKTLAAVRSLGKKGIRAIVSEETKFNPSGFSKYCTKSLKCPKITNGEEAYFMWLKDTIKKHGCDILFPMDDDTMNIAIKFRNELNEICKMYIPPTESYNIACDKKKTMEFVENCEAPIPKTYSIEDINQLDDLTEKVMFPVIIKPRNSSGSRGIRIVSNKTEFLDEYLKIHLKYPLPIVQDFIGTGDRYDVCLLYNEKSELKASFVQKELRHFPLKYGPSTLQESTHSEHLVEISDKIMRRLKWVGIAELEFMVDSRDGKFKFMEINPRFWASLQLSIIAGVDFPHLLFRLNDEGDIEDNFSYKDAIKCSWLLPGDILHFLANKNRFKMNPPLFSGKKKGVYDDIVMKEDFMPVVGFKLAVVRYLFDIRMWKFFFKR
ncbi:MAG: ATP-grasp domain-containing protein [Clostridia bacterium]|jgi:predicted ATP-grasp superfamily ATP-dependent carboligase